MVIDKVCPFLAATICHDGIPASWNLLNCDRVICRAWVPEERGCHIADECPDCDTGPCGETCPKRADVIVKDGFCKLLK